MKCEASTAGAWRRRPLWPRAQAVLALSLSLALLYRPAHATTPEDLSRVVADDLYSQAQQELSNQHPEQTGMLLDTLVRLGPAEPGTWLDIAVMYCELGREDDSKALLERVRRDFDPPDGIRRLIELRLAEPCVASFLKPYVSVSTSVGWTSNANSGPSVGWVNFAPGAPVQGLELARNSLARPDGFVALDLVGELPVRMAQGWSFIANAGLRQYREVRDFNSAVAGVGVVNRTSLGTGLLESQLNVAQSWLGGEPYSRFAGLQSGYWFGATRLSGIPARFGTDVALAQQSYASNGLYDSRRIDVRLRAEFQPTPYLNLLVAAGPAWDTPIHDRPGGARDGYSALLALNLQAWKRQKLTLLFQQQLLRESAPYSPVFFGDTVRHQTSRQFLVRYTIPVLSDVQLFAQFLAQDVADSIPIFSYRTYSGSLGLALTF